MENLVILIENADIGIKVVLLQGHIQGVHIEVEVGIKIPKRIIADQNSLNYYSFYIENNFSLI